MPLESPVSVLYSGEGVELSLTASSAVSSNTPGLLAMASGSSGAQFLRLIGDGALYVSGNFGGATPTTQSVNVASWNSGVTGSVFATLVGTPDVQINSPVEVFVTAPLEVTIENTASVRTPGSIGTFVSSAAASVSAFTILPQRPSRRGALFWKEGNNLCYLALGSTVSDTNYTVRISNNGYFELPYDYVGPVSVIFSNANAANVLRVTEITASL